AAHSITATFKGKGGAGSVPRTDRIYCSFLTDNLPGSGNIAGWASYLPAGKTLKPLASPEVAVIDERKFVSNRSVESDGLDLGPVAAPIPCAGATIVAVAKPVRLGSDPGWTSLVDLCYDRLVLGIMNGSGKVVVRRNGSLETSMATIPDGQTTILSLVVQQSGAYKVYANGTRVMDVTSASDMSSLVPGVAGGFANRITFGRNWPDGWTTFNGCFGDLLVYTTALTDTERERLETFLSNRLTASGSASKITSTTGSGPP
ncbi:MAG: LamG domain-containing protein, partial [Akkermansiaceae bacterium]|nr:LamG domain-containing protein [Akkermansiaceae bacterium]